MNKVKNKNIRTRIAPSPTGFLHIGTARTALVNYLEAKKNNGHFILRIEDTDLERSSERFEKDIIDGLKWLGICWDEGVEVGGDFAPYRQSERLQTYKKYIKELLEQGRAYHCFCSEEELENHRQKMLKDKKPAIYSGKCSTLGTREVQKKIENGEKSILRFRVSSKKIEFNDLIKGKVEFDTGLIGDISIAKDENTPLYNFAVVVDDYEMNINFVIRGEDHVSNTPKQMLIQEALGFPVPTYAHLPLVLSSDKKKMSKRDGAVSLIEYKKDGYLSEALINFLVLLGWNPGDDREIFSLDELTKEFDMKKFQKSGAIFNIKKLDWFNAYYIKKKNIDELTELCIPYIEEADLIEKKGSNFFIKLTKEKIEKKWLQKIIALEKERIKKLSEISYAVSFFFVENIIFKDPKILIWRKSNKEKAIEVLGEIMLRLNLLEKNKFNINSLKEALEDLTKKYSNGDVLWPLRVALSGREASPGPFEIAEILGKEKTINRIKNAIKALS